MGSEVKVLVDGGVLAAEIIEVAEAMAELDGLNGVCIRFPRRRARRRARATRVRDGGHPLRARGAGGEPGEFLPVCVPVFFASV